MVSSPSAVHKSILNALMSGLTCIMETIPVPTNVLFFQMAPNSGYENKSICAIPDLMITSWSCNDEACHHGSRTIWLMESMFSQSNVSVMDKLQAYVDDEPDLLIVGKILIKQATLYCSPSSKQSISKKLLSSALLPKDEWTRGVERYSEIVVDKHTWFSLSSVEFHVWTRKPGASKIDLDSLNGDGYAFGVSICFIYPGSNINNVILFYLPDALPRG